MVHIQAADRASPFRELMRVKTRRVLREGDGFVPAGTIGTIVHVYETGRAFEVEFADFAGIVLTADRSDLDHA